jgi:hypothetical protein
LSSVANPPPPASGQSPISLQVGPSSDTSGSSPVVSNRHETSGRRSSVSFPINASDTANVNPPTSSQLVEPSSDSTSSPVGNSARPTSRPTSRSRGQSVVAPQGQRPFVPPRIPVRSSKVHFRPVDESLIIDITSILQRPVLASRPINLISHLRFGPPVVPPLSSDWRVTPDGSCPEGDIIEEEEEPEPEPVAPPIQEVSHPEEEEETKRKWFQRGYYVSKLQRAAGDLQLPIFNFGNRYRNRNSGPVRANGIEIDKIPEPSEVSALEKPKVQIHAVKIEIPDLSEFIKIDEIDVGTIKLIESKDLTGLDEFYDRLPQGIGGKFQSMPVTKQMRHPCDKPRGKRPEFVCEVPELNWD